jgi:DNA-binding beta-propeller fold protein YncE
MDFWLAGRAVVAAAAIMAAVAAAVAATQMRMQVMRTERLLDRAAAVAAVPRSSNPALEMLASKRAKAIAETGSSLSRGDFESAGRFTIGDPGLFHWESLVNHRSIITALAAVAMLAACSTIGNAPTPFNTSIDSQGKISKPEASRASSSHTNLYVANAGNATVTVYARGSNSVLRTISEGLTVPSALAFDGAGSLYVLNCEYCYSAAGDVTVYAAKSGKLLRTISGSSPAAIAVDQEGLIFIADYSDSIVKVYGSRGSRPLRTISKGIKGPRALALDRSGNLYVANCDDPCLGRIGGGTVTVYAAGGTTLSRTISQGVRSPVRLLIDSTGDLYVANYGTNSTPSFGGTIAAYAPGQNAPYESISQGVNGPIALAYSPSGTLFVGNCVYLCAYGSYNGFVSAYAADKTKPARMITQGVVDPAAMSVGSFGYLFVANPNSNTVQVYAPGSKTVHQTISQGISYPLGVAFGP